MKNCRKRGLNKIHAQQLFSELKFACTCIFGVFWQNLIRKTGAKNPQNGRKKPQTGAISKSVPMNFALKPVLLWKLSFRNVCCENLPVVHVWLFMFNSVCVLPDFYPQSTDTLQRKTFMYACHDKNTQGSAKGPSLAKWFFVPWCCWHAWPFLRLVWPVLHSGACMSHECCMHVTWMLHACPMNVACCMSDAFCIHACRTPGMISCMNSCGFSTCMHVWSCLLHAWTWVHACWCQNCAAVAFLRASCVDKKMCCIPFSLRCAAFRENVTPLEFLFGRQHVVLVTIDV